MPEERKSVIYQFYIMVACNFGLMLAQLVYLFTYLNKKSNYQTHAIYLVANQVFSAVPSIYMLCQHYKTFRLGDADDLEAVKGINITASDNELETSFSDEEGATITLDQFHESEINVL